MSEPQLLAEALPAGIGETLTEALTTAAHQLYPDLQVVVTQVGPLSLRIAWDASSLDEAAQLQATRLLGRLVQKACTLLELPAETTFQLAETLAPKAAH